MSEPTDCSPGLPPSKRIAAARRHQRVKAAAVADGDPNPPEPCDVCREAWKQKCREDYVNNNMRERRRQARQS